MPAEDKEGKVLGMGVAHLAFCHTGVMGEGAEMFPKCGPEMGPPGLEKVEDPAAFQLTLKPHQGKGVHKENQCLN